MAIANIDSIIHFAVDYATFCGFRCAKTMSAINQSIKRNWNLKQFILSSSVSTDQCTYVCSNRVLDSLSRYRKSIGLTSICTNYGSVQSTGLVSRNKSIEQLLDGRGLASLSINIILAIKVTTVFSNESNNSKINNNRNSNKSNSRKTSGKRNSNKSNNRKTTVKETAEAKITIAKSTRLSKFNINKSITSTSPLPNNKLIPIIIAAPPLSITTNSINGSLISTSSLVSLAVCFSLSVSNRLIDSYGVDDNNDSLSRYFYRGKRPFAEDNQQKVHQNIQTNKVVD
ncbi:hypothetical protein ACTA71_002785 [Dictyostelium dimigraforme]